MWILHWHLDTESDKIINNIWDKAMDNAEEEYKTLNNVKIKIFNKAEDEALNNIEKKVWVMLKTELLL